MKKQISLFLFICWYSLYYSQINTQTRDDAGLRGDAGATSGFYQTTNPINFPIGARSWWHLLDIRHTNPSNNYALQLAGSFYDQDLWFRKTNNNAQQPWRKMLSYNQNGLIGINNDNPESILDIRANENIPIIRGNGGYIPTGLRFIDDSYTQPGQVKEWAIWKGNTWAKGLAFMRYDAVNRCATGICDVPLFLHDNGNIGVGVMNPEYKLQVQGSILGSQIISTGVLNSSMNGIIGGTLVLTNSSKNQPQEAMTWQIFNMAGSYGNSLQFWRYDSTGGIIGSTYALKIADDGNMSLQGKLEAKEVKVVQVPTADFVFEKEYKFPTLEEVEKHIKEKKHLPEIASAKQMEKDGLNVGEFQIKLLQKIEELTLYSIEQNKLLKKQAAKIEKLSLENQSLQNQLSVIRQLEERLQQLESTKK